MGELVICWWALALTGKWTWSTKNGGFGRWFSFSIGMTLRGPAVNFPWCTFIHPKKTGWLQLGKWNLGVWKCFVKVIFVWTVFLREFPPILGTVVFFHWKDVHLENCSFLFGKSGQVWNACLRLPDFLLKTFFLLQKRMVRYFYRIFCCLWNQSSHLWQRRCLQQAASPSSYVGWWRLTILRCGWEEVPLLE